MSKSNTSQDTIMAESQYDSEGSNSSNQSSVAADAVPFSATIFDIAREYNLVWMFRREGSDKINFRFTPKKGMVVAIDGNIVNPAEIFFANIRSYFGEEFGSLKINQHSDRISFPNFETFERWREAICLNVKQYSIAEQKSADKKKVVVIGAGDVGICAIEEFNRYRKERSLDCEVVLLNRSKDYVLQYIDDISTSRYKEEPELTVAENDYEALIGADLIVITAGVNAARIGGQSRQDALLYNIEIIQRYAKMIKDVASSAKVIIVTNPIEQVAKLFQEFSELPPENIVASGVGLDSIRYSKFIQNELEKHQIIGQIEASVIGQHSADGMIFLRDSITLNSRPIAEFVNRGVISQEALDSIFENAENRTRTEGMSLINRKHGTGACYSPAAAAANLGVRLLFGENALDRKLPAAIYTESEHGPCYVGMDVIVRDGKFVPNEEECAKYSSECKSEILSVCQKLTDARKQMSANPYDLISVSQTLNEALQKNEAGSDIIEKLTKIRPYSLDSLADSKVAVSEIFTIFQDRDRGKISVTVKAPYSSVADKLLDYFEHVLFGAKIISNPNMFNRESGKLLMSADEEALKFLTAISPESSRQTLLNQDSAVRMTSKVGSLLVTK